MPYIFPRPILNNGYVFNVGGSPFKPNTMEQGSSLTNSKRSYNANNYSKTKIGDSSEVIANKRRLAVGQNSNRVGVSQGISSSYANTNINDVNHALKKSRSNGYVSPQKKSFIK